MSKIDTTNHTPVLTFRFPKELTNRLTNIAETQGIPRSELIRQILMDYLSV